VLEISLNPGRVPENAGDLASMGEIPNRGRVQRHCICNQYIFHHQYKKKN